MSVSRVRVDAEGVRARSRQEAILDVSFDGPAADGVGLDVRTTPPTETPDQEGTDGSTSGGSAGYDHKKMGITARGVWESVKRHFREMGINTETDDFTVIGVGDMSGDVFGNGMLLSKHIKLIGAFNHMHIFVDPDPDPAVSWKERNRLFKMGRSSWSDYDAKLISDGGGIFERVSKSIKLTSRIAEL